MATREILREYLAALGFAVDDASYKKFMGSVAKATSQTALLGEAAIEAGLAVGYMVEKSAREYERLNYLSQRSGQSVAFLKSYEFAARQVGVSQDAARASTEAFAASLRTNIGLQGMAAAMGIDTGAKGGPAAAVARLKEIFGNTPAGYMVAQRFGSMLGIDEQTFKQYFDNAEKLKAVQDEQIRRQQRMGVAGDEMKNKFNEFTQSLNQFEETLGNVKDRVAMDWAPTATTIIKSLDDILQRFGELDKASGGNIGMATGAIAAFGGLALLKRILGKVGGAFLGRAAAGGATGAAGLVTEAGGGAALRSILAGSSVWAGALMALLYPTNSTHNDEQEAALRMPNPGGAIGARDKNGKTRGDRNNNPGNIEYGPFAIKMGAVGTDGRFAIFPDKATGQAAMDELLRKNYAGLTLSQIQRKWVGNDDPRYLAGLEKQTGLGAGDVPNMADPAVRAAIAKGIALGEGTTLTPSPMAAGAGQVNITHDTDINIHGPVTGDMKNQIFDAQVDLYGKAVRDGLGRTR